MLGLLWVCCRALFLALGRRKTLEWHTSFACQHYGICCQLVLLWGQRGSLLKFNSDSPLPQMQFNAVCWSRKVVLDKERFVQSFASLGRASGARESYACSSEWVEQHSSDGVILNSKRCVRSKAGRDTLLWSRELRWVLSSQHPHHSLIQNVLHKCVLLWTYPGTELSHSSPEAFVLYSWVSLPREQSPNAVLLREAGCHVYVGL